MKRHAFLSATIAVLFTAHVVESRILRLVLFVVVHTHEEQAVGRRSSAGGRAILRGQDRADTVGRPFGMAHLNKRPNDRANHMFQESVGVRMNLSDNCRRLQTGSSLSVKVPSNEVKLCEPTRRAAACSIAI